MFMVLLISYEAKFTQEWQGQVDSAGTGGSRRGNGWQWLERTRPGLSSDRDRGQTHNPNWGFLFKASWSGFITCRTFRLFVGKFVLFPFFSFILSRFDWAGPQLEPQGVTSWGSRESARVSFHSAPIPFYLGPSGPQWKISNCTLHSGSSQAAHTDHHSLIQTTQTEL